MARTNISNAVSISSRRGSDPEQIVTRRFNNLITGVTDNQLLGIERIVNSLNQDQHERLLLNRVDEINPD